MPVNTFKKRIDSASGTFLKFYVVCCTVKKKKNRINTKSNRQLKVWYQSDHYRKYCNSRKVQLRIFNDHCSAELQAHFDQKEISNAHRCVRVFLYATTGNDWESNPELCDQELNAMLMKVTSTVTICLQNSLLS